MQACLPSFLWLLSSNNFALAQLSIIHYEDHGPMVPASPQNHKGEGHSLPLTVCLYSHQQRSLTSFFRDLRDHFDLDIHIKRQSSRLDACAGWVVGAHVASIYFVHAGKIVHIR